VELERLRVGVKLGCQQGGRIDVSSAFIRRWFKEIKATLAG
jgi:hypothetical protein